MTTTKTLEIVLKKMSLEKKGHAIQSDNGLSIDS